MTDQQYLVICQLLCEIRDGVLALGYIDEPATDQGCLHPDEARISLATPGDPFHWICNQCRYEHHSASEGTH